MKRCIPLYLVLALLLSACSSKYAAESDNDRISFLSQYGIEVNTKRPYYNSTTVIPEIFDTIWDIREILSKDVLNTSLKDYEGKQCQVYMYHVSKLPFIIKKDSSIETRAVIVSYKNSIICSYIEFVSELRTLPPVSLKGKSLVELSGVKWNDWKSRIDSDGDKRLVIWQYYNALRSGNYEEAYSYIYDKGSIKKEDFIKAAKENSLLYIDFLNICQYKNPSGDECYFLVKAKVGDGKGKVKSSVYEITFDLKKDPKAKDYGGWKIYKTKIK